MNFKQRVFQAFLSMGKGQQVLQAYQDLIGEPPFTRHIEVGDKIRDFQLSKTERNGYVLFPLIPGYNSLCKRFCVLGHVFRSKGYEPIILRDNGDLLIRPENTIDDEAPRVNTEACRYRARRYPELFGLNSVSIATVLTDEYELPNVTTEDPVRLRSFTYKNIELGSCATASMRKYLKKYRIDLTNDQIKRKFINFLRSGILLTDAIKNLISTHDIEVTMINEPNYIQGHIPMQICEKEDINLYTQGKGYHTGSILFGNTGNNNYMPQFSADNLVKKALKKELSTKKQSRIRSLIDDRKSGNVRRIDYTSDNELSVEHEEDLLVGIFSHLLWDGALEPEQAIYTDIYDWLDETIQTAIQKEDIQFIIKAHPAEHIVGTNESTKEFVRENYAPLPKNISVLPPDTKVNTYALIDDLDAGIVYASTVGLEMALDGVPVLVGGYPPYHGYNITHDPSTKSEYKEVLRNIENLDHDETRTARARRFAYFLFICKHFDFPYLSTSDKVIQFKHDEIASEDSVYTTIVDQILSGEEVIQPGCIELKEQY